MRSKLLRLSLFLTLILAFQLPAFGQEAEIAAIEKKKRDRNIRWGEAEALSVDEAKQKAEIDLTRKFKGALTGGKSLDLVNTADGGHEDYAETMSRTLFATIDNMREISYSVKRKNKTTKAEETWHCVFVYITEEDYQRSQEDRRDEERSMIESGINQEQELRIAGALKYYNWALTVIRAYNDDDLTIEVQGKTENAKRWLESKIESVLSNLQFTVNENAIEVHDGSDYDKYTVVVGTQYAGNPVSSLDVTYFNGDDFQEVRANDGKMTLAFPDLAGLNNLDFKVQYRYSNEAKNTGGIVESIYKDKNASALILDMDRIAAVKVPFKYNAKKNTAKKAELSTAGAATAANTAEPIVKPSRTVTPEKAEHQLASAPVDYLASMQAVEKALKAKNYESVRHLFTPEGYKIFELLTSKSKIKVVGKPEYTVEETDLFTIGKGLPITVSRDRHSTTENLVFRFEKGTKKIKSVAFALTKRAEDDIFRAGADWHIDSRYSILTFMEDYQTAFHTQDLSYISKIFSDDAIIITGSFAGKDAKGVFSDDVLQSRGNRSGKTVVYKTQTKTEYLGNLEKCFKRNRWTHIDFEDNAMQKVNTGGLIENDVMWIEIKQNWNSSTYSDVGYLSLQINLVPGDGSKINVRSWTPDFVPIEELKERFPVNL